MKRTVDIHPVVGEQISYTDASGKVFELTVEKVMHDELIDAVMAGPAKSGTPIRFSSIKYDIAGGVNTWRYLDEVKPVASAPAPASAAAPATPANPPAPWQGRRRWVPPNEGGKS